MGVIAKGILRGCQGLFTPVSLGYPLSVFNKNSTLKGACKPAGSNPSKKKTRDRKALLGGSLTDWTLQTPLHYFKDIDTKWSMDTKLVWLSPDGVLSFCNTLGDIISEAFHAHHLTKYTRAYEADKKKKVAVSTGTSCEATEWVTDTDMNINKNFFGDKE